MSQHVTVQQTPFAQMPEGVLYDPSLSDKAVRVYGALLRHGSDPTNCYPSHDRIARLIGCSKRSVARPLDELEKGGWVERAKRYDANGARTSDGYMVRVSRAPVAQESATTTQENVDPPRAGAGGHHAQERDERESLERKPLNDTSHSAAPALVLLESRLNFDEFWNDYPRRNGKRLGKTAAEAAWTRLNARDRAAAVKALSNYSAGCGGFPKDPERYLRLRVFDDWQEPAVMDPARNQAMLSNREQTMRNLAAFAEEG